MNYEWIKLCLFRGESLHKCIFLVVRISVARVWPRTSKGITDLLWPQLSFDKTQLPSKKLLVSLMERQIN